MHNLKKLTDIVLIKKCHICGHLIESHQELQKCTECKKSFLPSNYFNKVHAKDSIEFEEMFLRSEELMDEDMIKGISVLW